MAIIDGNGFDATHPDFADRVLLEVCTAPSSKKCPNGEDVAEGPGMAVNLPDGKHGTSVAGVVHQFAPEAEFIFIGIMGSSVARNASPSTAYQWVIDNAEKYGIDALVMSYGKGWVERTTRKEGREATCPDPLNLDVKFAAMQALGIVPIAASGNQGKLTEINHPACLDHTVSVGWASETGAVHNNSNVADSLTLLAPSELATATIPERGPYESFGGTSGATPVVGALIAIGREINPDATVDELIATARATGSSVDDYEVKDLRLVDFLAFSQTLAGLPVSRKMETQIDAVFSLKVGRTVSTRDLCETGGFTFDCSDVFTVKSMRISGPACIQEGGSPKGIIPGTCVHAMKLQKYDREARRNVGLSQTKAIQFDVEAIIPSLIIDINIKVGEVLNGEDWHANGKFSRAIAGYAWGRPVFVSGDRSACLLAPLGPTARFSTTGGAPGSCILEIRTSELPSGPLEYRYFRINVT